MASYNLTLYEERFIAAMLIGGNAHSITKEVDKRYELHAAQRATKVDLADAKVEIIKWTMVN